MKVKNLPFELFAAERAYFNFEVHKLLVIFIFEFPLFNK